MRIQLIIQWQIGFLTEWQLYAQKLEGENWAGEKLEKSKLDKLSGMGDASHCMSIELTDLYLFLDQQIGQLYELMQAIRNPDGGGSGEK